jgi:endonuclease YncB( thermonuclease family)
MKQLKRMETVYALIIGLLLMAAMSVMAQPNKVTTTAKGKVTKITDGDTFTLFTEEGSTVTIHLYGIDCPELKQNFGAIAAYAAAYYIYGKDLYSRKITVVYVAALC